MRRTAKSWFIFSYLLTAACGDDPAIDLGTQSGRDPIQAEEDAGTRVARCDQAVDGTPCGLEKHCIFNVCADNVCGDGVPLGDAEACDDGNDREHDGCDSRCKLEVEPGCGNEIREPGEQCDSAEAVSAGTCTATCQRTVCGDNIVSPMEECDDGNASDGDRCSSQCRVVPDRCGDGDKDSVEACDDGNNLDGDSCQADCTLPMDGGVDAGSGKPDASTPMLDAGAKDAGQTVKDAGPSPVDARVPTPDAGAPKPDAGVVPPFGTAHDLPACKECRELNCADYQGSGLDLPTTCFKSEDPSFIQQCVDLMECAYQHDCGYNVNGTAECFCGTFDKATCQVAGNQNGPCIDEVYAAARTTNLKDVVDGLGVVTLPLGVAVYFQDCDTNFCPACLP